MAVIDLGTNQINIGDLPVEYAPFSFRDNRAYLIQAITTIQFPENIFSQFRIRATIDNGTYVNVLTHHIIDIPVTVTPSTFLFPFSNLYDGNGDVTLQVERLNFVRGTSDTTGVVTLQLTYDDSADVRTWL